MDRARVMFVDDNPSFLQTMRWVAQDRYEVTTVGSGDDAMNLIRGGRRFEAIVVDLWMPGLSGQALFEQIEEHDGPQAERVIFTTGGGLPPKLRAFADRRRTLLKPFSADELFDALAAVVEAA
jgi:CheY-like chemotaxis protein